MEEMLVILWEGGKQKNSLKLSLVGPDQKLICGWEEIYTLLHKTTERIATPYFRPSE